MQMSFDKYLLAVKHHLEVRKKNRKWSLGKLRDKPAWQFGHRLILLIHDLICLCHELCIMYISRVLVPIGPMDCKCLKSKALAPVLFEVLFGALHTRGALRKCCCLTDSLCWQPSARGRKKHLSQLRVSQESQSNVIFCINITGPSHAKKQT